MSLSKRKVGGQTYYYFQKGFGDQLYLGREGAVKTDRVEKALGYLGNRLQHYRELYDELEAMLPKDTRKTVGRPPPTRVETTRKGPVVSDAAKESAPLFLRDSDRPVLKKLVKKLISAYETDMKGLPADMQQAFINDLATALEEQRVISRNPRFEHKMKEGIIEELGVQAKEGRWEAIKKTGR